MFNTTVSEEWMHLSRILQLTEDEIFQICLDSPNHLFTELYQKQEIYNHMVSWYYKTNTNRPKDDCKFRQLVDGSSTSTSTIPSLSKQIQELCNEVRGENCEVHFHAHHEK